MARSGRAARANRRNGTEGSGNGADAEAEAEDASRRSLWSELPGLALAVVLALGIRACVLESFLVPSDSMFPTLLIGDHVFVTKFTYGAGVPFTPLHLPAVRDPRLGEVIVFKLARDPENPMALYPPDVRPDLPTEAFIKRLVALPGDVVEVREGELRINGEPVPRRRTGETFVDPEGRRFVVWEVDLGDCRHRVLDDPEHPGKDLAPRRVEEGRYFFMGDNRDNSADSRFWGSVGHDDLLGPSVFLYWSWDWTGGWLELLNPLLWWENLTGRTRWGRMGDFDACQPVPTSEASSPRSETTNSGAGPS